MTIQQFATFIPPHITRKAAYDRRRDGAGRVAFDLWLEKLK